MRKTARSGRRALPRCSVPDVWFIAWRTRVRTRVRAGRCSSADGGRRDRHWPSRRRPTASTRRRAHAWRRCCARLEAPKTIDWTLGCPHTHSIASRGGIAPDGQAPTWRPPGTAAPRARRGRRRRPPHIRNPSLLMLAQTIGFSHARALERVQQHRQVHRDEARLGAVAVAHVVGEDREGVVEAQPEEQVDDDVLHPDRPGCRRPLNIFISASTSSVAMPSTSLRPASWPPRSAASRSPSSGRNRRTAPRNPSSVTALAYLWA